MMVDSFQEGKKLYSLGEYEKSSEIFLELLNQDATNHKAWNSLGVCLSRLGNNEQASECFRNAVKLDPENTVYQNNFENIGIKNIEDSQIIKQKKKTHKKPENITPSHQVDKSENAIFFIGLLLLGFFFFAPLFGLTIPSPTRDIIGIGGILFIFVFLFTNLLKAFVGLRIPYKFIIFVILMITVIFLFIKFLFENHGV